MSRRFIAIFAAVVMAIIAALLVINYVNQADERAIAELEPQRILVVVEQVPEGTEAAALGEYLTVEEVPSSSVAPGALQSLDEVSEQVTASALYPGEQVLAARFASPEELDDSKVEVPEGYHEVSIQLSTNRVNGGHLEAGDTVGLFASSEGETRLVLHKVLVTRVQGGVQIVENEDGTETTQPAADALMVTLAVEADDAQIVVNAAEFYGVWLSLEPESAPEGLDTIVREDLFG